MKNYAYTKMHIILQVLALGNDHVNSRNVS